MRLCVDFYKKNTHQLSQAGSRYFLETVTPSEPTSSECSHLQSRAGVAPDRALPAQPEVSPDPQSPD